MPHVLIVDIDDFTLAELAEFIRQREPCARALSDDKARHSTVAASDGSSSLVSLKQFKLTGATTNAHGADVMTATTDSLARDESQALRASGHLLPTLHSRITLLFAGWRLEVASRELWAANDTSVAISSGEFELLFTFAKHPQRALTRHQIIDLMRGAVRLSHPRSVDVYVSRLRQKLESDVRSPQIIQTVRNGYKFSAPVTIR